MLSSHISQSLTLAVLAVSTLASVAAAECTRESLLATAEKYIAAQNSGNLADLQKFFTTTNFTYQENNQIIDLQKGVLAKPLKIEYSRSSADTVACASYTELVALTPTPYVIGTQIRHDGSGEVTMVDSIVATTGALFFNASATLGYFKSENWKPLDVPARPSRDVLQKAIDGYLDLFGGPNAATARSHLPFGSPCERTEGARYINCTDGMPPGGSTNTKAVSMRRYVIDEVTGSANVLCSFTAVGNIPDSHELRIENGKIRYVHTITLCAVDDGPDWGPTCIAERANRGKSTSKVLDGVLGVLVVPAVNDLAGRYVGLVHGALGEIGGSLALVLGNGPLLQDLGKVELDGAGLVLESLVPVVLVV
ncbi:hypothetical protein QBC34DRAFT_493955 [Podospora aff. communis PSN243]|uniref:DUF8021 domain-containing protein n=1 Tax=Podospora aff. communis PSN243 TaxID=3040156 RepID=A0AAV9GUK8_9PEZI|nr:hypothetical protein QBC34DRAFT_493955 [Podospora aff. communis PSN243]